MRSLLPLKLRLDSVVDATVGYFTFDYLKARRLFFLHKVLLARGSVFRQCTYFHNGEGGNLDPHTDIIDNIMRFL